jgi:SAM-dependent methyltransferase
MTIDTQKPYSPSCDRNREPILDVLRGYFADRQLVLEIGSGTGQHAAHFARALPHLVWQTSDVADNLSGIRAWLLEACLPNTPEPIELNVNGAWPRRRFDAVFTANTLHIMSWGEVLQLFAALDRILTPDAVVVVYGPFNFEGRFTSASNAAFDASLKARAAHMGIRDAEAVMLLAEPLGLRFVEDISMPANNRMLIWRRP